VTKLTPVGAVGWRLTREASTPSASTGREGIAHPVLAEAGEIAGRRALARRRDRDILRIAAEALQPGAAVAFASAG
jgi:hypothetical protein